MKKKIDKLERMFIHFYLISIIIGMVWGSLVPPNIKDNLILTYSANEFFRHNLRIEVISFVSGGMLGLLVNFITMANLSALIQISLHPELYLVTSIFGVTELLGGLFISLAGFVFIFSYVLRRYKSNINILNLFIVGGILLFISAYIEIYVGLPIIRMMFKV